MKKTHHIISIVNHQLKDSFYVSLKFILFGWRGLIRRLTSNRGLFIVNKSIYLNLVIKFSLCESVHRHQSQKISYFCCNFCIGSEFGIRFYVKSVWIYSSTIPSRISYNWSSFQRSIWIQWSNTRVERKKYLSHVFVSLLNFYSNYRCT